MVERERRINNAVLQVFAKEPLPGEVNTRLIPHIGVARATSMQDELIRHRLQSVAGSDLYDVQLWCTPDHSSAYFQCCEQQYNVQLHSQTGVDLGQRMANAITYGLTEYNYVVLIGTDAPALNTGQINSALEKLQQGNDVAIVPAEDGGYVLIAMQDDYAGVFASVDWGSGEVCAQTIANINTLKLQYALLEPCWDIDRIEDYHRYQQFRVHRD